MSPKLLCGNGLILVPVLALISASMLFSGCARRVTRTNAPPHFQRPAPERGLLTLRDRKRVAR